jgi:DNA-binding GntR family transcriptional regulator
MDVYDIRGMLEGRALELAVEWITDDDLKRMWDLLPDTIMTSDPQSAETAWRANREFHWIPIRASRRPHLIRLLESFWELSNPYLFVSTAQESVLLDLASLELEDHTRILQALEARDGVTARDHLVEHFRRVLNRVAELLAEKDIE